MTETSGQERCFGHRFPESMRGDLLPLRLLLPLLLALLVPLALRAGTAKDAVWRAATPSELAALLPARAPVVSERIETELRSASGITDGKGHYVAGIVLITAGYSAEGKYSHYFLAQVPVQVGNTTLKPGQYLIGWQRGEKQLNVTIYEALTGRPIGSTVATIDPEIRRVEEFRIWPPSEKHLIQLGRFTFPYSLTNTPLRTAR